MLIVISGLPGTGKSTIARALVEPLRATYLRIDVIEHAIRPRGGDGVEVGPEGYLIAYALAASNLALGRVVVADCVNALPVTRDAWREVAREAHAPLLEVELVATDVAEHRRRVETRAADIPGAPLPTWADVTARDYAPWPEPHLVIDTTHTSLEAAVTTVRGAVAGAMRAAARARGRHPKGGDRRPRDAPEAPKGSDREGAPDGADTSRSNARR